MDRRGFLKIAASGVVSASLPSFLPLQAECSGPQNLPPNKWEDVVKIWQENQKLCSRSTREINELFSNAISGFLPVCNELVSIQPSSKVSYLYYNEEKILTMASDNCEITDICTKQSLSDTPIINFGLSLAIHREIIFDLLNVAKVYKWNFGSAYGDSIKEKYESLYIKIVELSNVVHRKTLRGGCNWLVTSPEIASIFETATAGFAPVPMKSSWDILHVHKIGTVNKAVYVDPLLPKNKILMGYKGESQLDSGYIYSPYAFYSNNGIIHLLRDKKLVNPDFYQTIEVEDFLE